MSETFKNHAKVCTSVLLTLYLLLTCSSLAILIWFMFIKDAWQENEYWGWWLHQSSRWGLRHAGHGWKWNHRERGYRVRRQMIPCITLSVYTVTIPGSCWTSQALKTLTTLASSLLTSWSKLTWTAAEWSTGDDKNDDDKMIMICDTGLSGGRNGSQCRKCLVKLEFLEFWKPS